MDGLDEMGRVWMQYLQEEDRSREGEEEECRCTGKIVIVLQEGMDRFSDDSFACFLH